MTGRPLVDYLDDQPIWNTEVITPRAEPLIEAAGIAVLKGNLAPNGAIIKPSAASPHLMQHRGKAIVFDSIEDFHARVDDPDLDVTPDSVLILRGCGPMGYPGMPEVANLPLPQKILQAGRARHGPHQRRPDVRAPPTARSCCTSRPRPRPAACSRSSQDGDEIVLDVAEPQSITLDVPEEVLALRTPSAALVGGYAQRGPRLAAAVHRARAGC